MKMRIIKPKGLKTDKPTKAVIYLHGGGMTMFDVVQMTHQGARRAVSAGAPVFMPDFENAPENKAPGFVLECYAGLKWVIENTATYNIDTKRICVTGESSGGYLTAAVGYELAKRDESHLVKLLFCDIPMVASNTWLDLPDDKLRPVALKCKKQHIASTLMNMTDDFENIKQLPRDQRDPYIFPADMPDDIMAKLPPVFVSTREHDNYRQDAEYFAERLQKHGKLLELYIFPGACHYTMMQHQQLMDDFKKVYEFFL